MYFCLQKQPTFLFWKDKNKQENKFWNNKFYFEFVGTQALFYEKIKKIYACVLLTAGKGLIESRPR